MTKNILYSIWNRIEKEFGDNAEYIRVIISGETEYLVLMDDLELHDDFAILNFGGGNRFTVLYVPYDKITAVAI